MNTKSFLVILLFLFWSLISGWYYVCEIKKVCPSSEGSSLSDKSKSLTVFFTKNSHSPDTALGYASFRQNLLERFGSQDSLIITGLYSATEVNGTSFENLGLARAYGVMNLLDIDLDRVRFESSQVSFADTSARIDGVAFRIFVINDVYEENESGILIKEVDSLDFSKGSKLDAYLQFISIERGDRNIEIIGHTDDEGDEGENFRLALSRANQVREALISKGMPAENIVATSKGQTQPIAENGTKSGRAQNRRIELLIN